MPDNPDITHLGRNTRIMLGHHVAEIFAENTGPGAVFHWTVRRSDQPGVIVLGEQSTYEVARQEAEHHLLKVVEAENAGPSPLVGRVASA